MNPTPDARTPTFFKAALAIAGGLLLVAVVMLAAGLPSGRGACGAVFRGHRNRIR